MNAPALDLRSIANGGTDVPAAPQLARREQAWVVSYTDPEGGKHSDSIVSRVLSADERMQVSRASARLAACPWDQLPAGSQARIWAMALVAVQVREPPAWFTQWAAEDDVLLFAVFGRCTGHAADFFRANDGEGEGDSGQSRVVFASDVSTADPA